VLRRTAVTIPNENGERPLPDRFLRRIDEIEICAVLRSVHVCGREVQLTPTEFDVLMVLAGRTNTVLSRAEIICRMRGENWAMNDRAVDNAISGLRRKMFPDGSGSRRIRTIHGRGYMLTQTTPAPDD
jgi:DNA-binding response OmpR family regulator